jgi:hypothetical protein
MVGVQSRMLQVSRATLFVKCGCHSVLVSLVSCQTPATAEMFDLILLTHMMIHIGSDSWDLFVKKKTVTHPNACRILDYGDVQERKGGQ